MKSAKVIKMYEHSKANPSVISTCFVRSARSPPVICRTKLLLPGLLQVLYDTQFLVQLKNKGFALSENSINYFY